MAGRDIGKGRCEYVWRLGVSKVTGEGYGAIPRYRVCLKMGVDTLENKHGEERAMLRDWEGYRTVAGDKKVINIACEAQTSLGVD